MKPGEDRQKPPEWTKIIGVAIAASVVAGPVGAILVGICFAFYYFYQNSRKREGKVDSFTPMQNNVQGRILNTIQEESSALALVHAQSSYETPSEHRDRHMLELKDLLNAGIIERDEYEDRVRAIKG